VSLFESLLFDGGGPGQVERCEIAVGAMDLGTPMEPLQPWCWTPDGGAVSGRCPEPIVDPVPTAPRLEGARFAIGDRIRVDVDFVPDRAFDEILVPDLACEVDGLVYGSLSVAEPDLPAGTRAHYGWYFFDPLNLPGPPSRCELAVPGVGQLCSDERGVTAGACPGLVRVAPPAIALHDVAFQSKPISVPVVHMNRITAAITRPAAPVEPEVDLALECSDGKVWSEPFPPGSFGSDLDEVAPGETVFAIVLWQTDAPILGCDARFTDPSGVLLARYCLTPGRTTPWSGACLTRQDRSASARRRSPCTRCRTPRR
jgi:hypothetical protein